jgi:hypothetical protein
VGLTRTVAWTWQRGTASSPTASNSDKEPKQEAAKARCEFQRDLFKVRDGRITAADNVGSVLSATAATIATIATAVLKDAERSAWWIVAVLALAVLAVLMALLARRETPLRVGEVKRLMKRSEEAVRSLHQPIGSSSATAMYNNCFDAWLAVTQSAEQREKQKRRAYSAATMLLLIEVLVATLGIAEWPIRQ